MASKKWCQLDLDFFNDEKVSALEYYYGKETCFDWVKMVCLCYGHTASLEGNTIYGAIDLNDPVSMASVIREMRMTEPELTELIEKFFQVKLFKREWYEIYKILGSERTVEQGESMARSISQKREAAKKSAIARKTKKEADA